MFRMIQIDEAGNRIDDYDGEFTVEQMREYISCCDKTIVINSWTTGYIYDYNAGDRVIVQFIDVA